MAFPSQKAASRPTVLVVDDSREALDGLCNLLKADCNALFGLNGLEALALATSEAPDLIVLDVAMHGMDGYQVLQRLKEEPTTRDIPVIFLTAPGPGISEARALELGAIDFITKPYDPAILKARMRNQLAYKRSLDDAMALSLGDALTGIPNRRRFDIYLEQEWNRGLRIRRPLSLILIDIDHFKRYNDALGHPAGDECLRKVAKALDGSLKRSTDFVARYGGEEFVCVLAETEASSALEMARRIAKRVEAAQITHPDSPLGPLVTLSMGVATLTPGPEMLPVDLTLEADRRLYEAKRTGRNRIQSEAVRELTLLPASVPGILLVDDDLLEQALVLQRLAGFGLDAMAVASVPEAMDRMLHCPPALVLSVGSMSGGDGYTFCQWVRQTPALARIPFAILASPWDGPWERSIQAGADDCLLKSEEDAVLRGRITMLLDSGQLSTPDAPKSGILVLSAPGPQRALLLSLLSQEAIRTTFASDLEEALTALEQDAPDALILDLDLLDGAPAETLDHMRSKPGCARLPILVLASHDQALLVDALDERIQDRLETPLEIDTSRHRIRMLARCGQARRNLAQGSRPPQATSPDGPLAPAQER